MTRKEFKRLFRKGYYRTPDDTPKGFSAFLRGCCCYGMLTGPKLFQAAIDRPADHDFPDMYNEHPSAMKHYMALKAMKQSPDRHRPYLP